MQHGFLASDHFFLLATFTSCFVHQDAQQLRIPTYREARSKQKAGRTRAGRSCREDTSWLLLRWSKIQPIALITNIKQSELLYGIFLFQNHDDDTSI